MFFPALVDKEYKVSVGLGDAKASCGTSRRRPCHRAKLSVTPCDWSRPEPQVSLFQAK